MYKRAVDRLFEAVVEVGDTLASGDANAVFRYTNLLQVGPEDRATRDLHVNPDLRTRGKLARGQLVHRELRRLALQTIREVGRGRRSTEGEDRDHKQANEQRGIPLDPGTKSWFLGPVVGKKLLIPYRFLVDTRIHCPKFARRRRTK